jgi:hypothetical protein
VSREISRNGGYNRYRAMQADKQAWVNNAARDDRHPWQEVTSESGPYRRLRGQTNVGV